MSEEKEPKEETTSPDSLKEGASTAPPADPLSKKDGSIPAKSKPVLKYLFIMFAVALLLLLLSFLMQQRNHDALMQGISSSRLNTQLIVDLEVENMELKDEIEALEDALSKAQEELESAAQREEALQQEADALLWLAQLRSLYDQEQLEEAKALLNQFQEAGLADSIPDRSPSGTESGQSAKALYDEMVIALAE